MRTLVRLIWISAIAGALSASCKSDVRPHPEPAPTPVTTAQAAGVCGAAAEKTESCSCEHDKGTGEKPVVPMTEAKVGDRTTCPVMNTVFTVLPDSPKVEVSGKTIYFCCDGCASKFKENPKQFLDS
jgi:hypothetical protein